MATGFLLPREEKKISPRENNKNATTYMLSVNC